VSQQQYALVTGGGQGIGRAVAGAFAGRGFGVVILEEDEEAGREALADIERAGGQGIFLAVDVSDEAAVAAAMADLGRCGVTVAVLINNAGISRPTPLEAPTADWDRVLAVNLRGPYIVAKYALPLLTAGAVIINIASTRAYMSEPNWHAYAAAKGGMVALTHSLAVSLGERGIRANCICPGWIDTSGWKKSRLRQSADLRPIDHAQHPVGRVGKPEDIAAACLFLASAEAGFITGASLIVDGGMTRKMIYEE
jgi:NAD(P)-dependent dehydrogenase (short-subunit alcohol dehydrogenase family)